MTAPWTADPRAVALLASCAANPPAAEWHRKVYVLTADEWFTYTGSRADRLRAIHNEHTTALTAKANRTGADADWALVMAHLRDAPTVEQAISAAIEAAADAKVAA